MSDKQQTAVDWLIQKIKEKNGEEYFSYIAEFEIPAKEMHKQEIVDALKSNVAMYIGGPTEKEIEEYYNETFNQ
jgi:hypothetical protein